jgi:Flp pilus assembly pilin Flp
MEEYLAPEKRDKLIQNGLIALGVILAISLIGNWLSNKIAKKVAKKLKN